MTVPVKSDSGGGFSLFYKVRDQKRGFGCYCRDLPRAAMGFPAPARSRQVVFVSWYQDKI